MDHHRLQEEQYLNMAYSNSEYLDMFNTLLRNGYSNMFFPWKSDYRANISENLSNIIKEWDSLPITKRKIIIKNIIRNNPIFDCLRVSNCIDIGSEYFNPTDQSFDDCNFDGFDDCVKKSFYLKRLIKFMNSFVFTSINNRINVNYFYQNKNFNSSKKPRDLRK
jgi:hypothetical protein